MKTSSQEIFLTSKPISEKISPYISYYYFHSSTDKNHNSHFEYYPNYKHAITAYRNSETIFKEKSFQTRPSTYPQISILYSINKNQNIKVNIQGAFHKVGIVFNPLGINFFIKDHLQDIFPFEIGAFDYFGEEFKLTLEQVFTTHSIDQKTALLDEFFERNYVGFSEKNLKKAVHEILLSNGSIKVNKLSEKLNINRRTLLRLFKQHTKMTVEEYRKMVMFRQAFNYYNQHKEKTNLTDVALFSMYYDQAHFIKHFKAITKETPTTLLSKISHIGEEDTYWYFKK